MKKRIPAIFLSLAMFALICTSFTSLATSERSVVKIAQVYGIDRNDEYIIANINVKEAPYNAKGDGVTNDTEAIQSALDDVDAGGIVYVPAGKYVIKDELVIPDQCTLVGDWDVPTKENRKETILLAYKGKGEEKGSPFICVGNASTLKNISVYYPEQDPNNIQPYPITIGFFGVSTLVDGVTLYNSYYGINTHLSNGSAQHVFNLYGTPLSTGISFDINLEVTELANVNFDIDIWANSGFDNAPITADLQDKVREQTKKAKGITCGRIDDMFMWNIDVDPQDYDTGVLFYTSDSHENKNLRGGTYGHFLKMHDTIIIAEGISSFGVNIDLVDDIIDPDDYDYQLSSGRRTTKNNIVSVKESAYGAAGDGETDDTKAFKDAISAVAGKGGGIVFVPQGQFKITEPIVIPSNVELRGVMTGTHSAFRKNVSQLNIYTQKGDDAAITLLKDSGINGLSFFYPENKLNELVELPVTVKGNGSNIWVKAVTFINSYDAIDLASAKCDNFFVGNTWGTAMRYGIYVGGGSENGVLENTMISFGIWQETRALHSNPQLDMMTGLFKKNSVAYCFENCKNITAWSVFGFGNHIGALFQEKDGKVADNITFYRLGLDTPWAECSLKAEKAGQVNIYGISTASHEGPGIYESGDIGGQINIYGQNIWGGCTNQLESNSKINIYSSSDAYFKQGKNIYAPVVNIETSSDHFNTEYDSYHLTDPYFYTLWACDETDEKPTLTFELNKKTDIRSIEIQYGYFKTGDKSDIPQSYTIQAGNDNKHFKNILEVKNNTSPTVIHNIKKTNAKYFRIVFHDSQQSIKVGTVKFLTEKIAKEQNAPVPVLTILLITICALFIIGTVLFILVLQKKKIAKK